MALIKCAQCEQMISSHADTCPHCGQKNQVIIKRSSVINTENPYKVKYEPEMLYLFANNLYVQARNLIISRTILGFFLGMLIGWVINARIDPDGLQAIGFVGLIGALLGYFGSLNQAAQIKLSAQVALCQVQIEQNTRPRA